MGSKSSEIRAHGLNGLDPKIEADRLHFPTHDVDRVMLGHCEIDQIRIPVRKGGQAEMILRIEGLTANKEHCGKQIPDAGEWGVQPRLRLGNKAVRRKDRSGSEEGVTHHHPLRKRLVHVEPGGNLTVDSYLPLVIDMIIPELPHPFIRASAGHDPASRAISGILLPGGIFADAHRDSCSPGGNPLPTETIDCVERVDRGKRNARYGREAGIPICIGIKGKIGISSGGLKGNSARTRDKKKKT